VDLSELQHQWTPFGTASYAIVEKRRHFSRPPTGALIESRFQNPVGWVRPIFSKLGNNTRTILQDELPRLGGSWVMPFFVVD